MQIFINTNYSNVRYKKTLQAQTTKSPSTTETKTLPSHFYPLISTSFKGINEEYTSLGKKIISASNNNFEHIPYSSFLEEIQKAKNNKPLMEIFDLEHKLSFMINVEKRKDPEFKNSLDLVSNLNKLKKQLKNTENQLKETKEKEKALQAMTTLTKKEKSTLNGLSTTIRSLKNRQRSLKNQIIDKECIVYVLMRKEDKFKEKTQKASADEISSINMDTIKALYKKISDAKIKYIRDNQQTTYKSISKLEEKEESKLSTFVGKYFEEIASQEVDSYIMPKIAKKLGLSDQQAKEQLVQIKNHKIRNFTEFDSMILLVDKNNPQKPAKVVGVVEDKFHMFDLNEAFRKREKDFYALSGNLSQDKMYQELSEYLKNTVAIDNNNNQYRLNTSSFIDMDPVKNPDWMENLYFITLPSPTQRVRMPGNVPKTQCKHYSDNCISFKITNDIFDAYSKPELQDNIIIIKDEVEGIRFHTILKEVAKQDSGID